MDCFVILPGSSRPLRPASSLTFIGANQMPTTYLVNIAIGPVQEFIASARRSRDMWFGSWLLSELSKAPIFTNSSKLGGTHK